MRYIKAYEFNFNPKEWFKRQKYKPGDYVILFIPKDLEKLEDMIKKLEEEIELLNIAKYKDVLIMQLNKLNYFQKKVYEKRYILIVDCHDDIYEIETYNGQTGMITDDQIDRKMTPEEIKEFEFKKTANKYNL